MIRSYRRRIFLWLGLIVLSCFLFADQSVLSSTRKEVHVIQLNDDTINPVTAEYISTSIDQAYAASAECLIIQLDTPGGLLTSTRQIVKKILTSRVPVVVYIAPSGSRAGSAGVFITYASHIAAMAPSTNIGAAHPVQMGNGKKGQDGESGFWKELKKTLEKSQDGSEGKELMEAVPEVQETKEEQLQADSDPMSSKILQDTLAFIRAIANQRGRNVEWAVKSVHKSSSITDTEALELGVVEYIADNVTDLLAQIDGQKVYVDGKEIILETRNAYVKEAEMSVRQKFFNVLANPNIAYIFMILGFYGLLYEITHPGFGVPGVLGTVFLILAFFSMQTLPTNYAALALIALGLALFVAEAFVVGFGVPTIGGLVCVVLGSFLLFETADPLMRVSWPIIIVVSGFSAATSLIVIRSLLQIMRKKPVTGKEGLIGSVGTVRQPIKFGKEGKVFVQGELWNASADEEIKKEEKVRIIDLDGLLLKVEKYDSTKKEE